MTPDIVAVTVEENHQILVDFQDGARRRFDMGPYLKYPAYRDLVDPMTFRQARVQHGTVVWRDDIDVSPDTVYISGMAV